MVVCDTISLFGNPDCGMLLNNVKYGKNFVGFMHPKTRRFMTVDKDGKFFIEESDVEALKILREAADIVEI